MNDDAISRQPATLEAIQRDTAELGFTMASEPKTGALLAALAASKPGGRLLELGTDTWHGKFTRLEQALALLRPGGMYFVDDLLPQPNWPAGHAPKVPALIETLERRPEFTTVKLAWASGLMLVVRSGAT